MKKQMLIWACIVIASSLSAASPANTSSLVIFEDKKPQRPEKLQEAIPDRPSEYHVWNEGRWKWKKKDQAWMWKSGSWSFDHDYYRWKTYNRFGRSINRYYRPRYLAVPIGRGLYRIVRY